VLLLRLKNNETPFLSANDEMMAAAKDRLLVVHNWDGGTYIPTTIVDIFKKSQQTAKNVFTVSTPPPPPNIPHNSALFKRANLWFPASPPGPLHMQPP